MKRNLACKAEGWTDEWVNPGYLADGEIGCSCTLTCSLCSSAQRGEGREREWMRGYVCSSSTFSSWPDM